MRMIYPKSWFLILKHTTLEEKRPRSIGELTSPSELWNVCQWRYANMRRNKQEYKGFYNEKQGSVTNVNLSMWKLISLLMKKEILPKNKKCDAEQRDESTSKRTRQTKTKQNNHQSPKYAKYYKWKFWKTSIQVQHTENNQLFVQCCHGSTHISNVFKYFVFCKSLFSFAIHFSCFIIIF